MVSTVWGREEGGREGENGRETLEASIKVRGLALSSHRKRGTGECLRAENSVCNLEFLEDASASFTPQGCSWAQPCSLEEALSLHPRLGRGVAG